MADPLGLIAEADPFGPAPSATVLKEIHYGRQQFNRTVTYEQAKKEGWIQMSPTESIYHRMGPGNENNIKFVSPDGKSEVVFRPDGTLVTDPVNMGTYNYVSPNKFAGIGHIIFDVIPYWLWGNTADDPTNIWERPWASYEGDPNELPCN